MKRLGVVVLILALAPAGVLVGYLCKPNPPADAGGQGQTKSGGSGDAPAPDPGFQIISNQPDSLKALLKANGVYQYEGGPAWIHAEYYVDFEEGGVKKRAFLQAFNLGADDGLALAPGDEGEAGLQNVKPSEGAIALSGDDQLRTVRLYRVGKRTEEPARGKKGSRDWSSGSGYSSWDVFDAYRQGTVDPKAAYVVDHDKDAKTTLYWTPDFQKVTGDTYYGGGGSPEHVQYYRMARASYGGREGMGVAYVSIMEGPGQGPPNAAGLEAEVARLRKELAAKTDDPVLKWKLAWAVDRKRQFVKKEDEADYALAEEAVKLIRDAARQQPANMLFRAELRRLLFRQASLMTEGKHAGEFPAVFEEALSLVPLYDAECVEAARLQLKWKDAELRKDPPEDEKKRITREADQRAVQLLRRYAEVWQNHPDKIKMELEAFEKDAAGKSYTETPEFKRLVEDMKGWAKKGA